MKFDELEPRQKERARRAYTGEGYLDYEWWSGVFEQANTAAEILGIKIEECEDRPDKSMPTGFYPAIFFSGFGSQGDGACFEGSYRWADEATDQIQKYAPEDTKLLRIAKELSVKQIARRLAGHPPLTASITRSGRYSHSGTMSVEISYDEDGNINFEVKRAITKLMRDFADWIYAQLEAEHDWLHSDECVDQYLVEKEFDEFGLAI